jgi:hypothetical protein
MAQSKYKVLIASRADNMLLLHVEFLAQVSPKAARMLVLGFKKVKDRLADNPFQFPLADELDLPGIVPDKYRKCLFSGRFKAIFLIEGRDVYVDAIIDCRQENNDLY